MSRWTATPRPCSRPCTLSEHTPGRGAPRPRPWYSFSRATRATSRSDTPTQEDRMAIKVGDRLPEGTLTEMIDTETPGCAIGPNNFAVADLAKGKRIVIFGLPGAFTPTCSAKHVPGYVTNY